ncbi:phage minor head protein [Synechococcus sp. 1G10]|uniref:phage minor head protein n=1 Tax=Synechococcus sp. 1G10 TaxID=2025605 RepID=UPI0013034576|nr:phage minor head protein [Synechococcus sp. 1G10]
MSFLSGLVSAFREGIERDRLAGGITTAGERLADVQRRIETAVETLVSTGVWAAANAATTAATETSRFRIVVMLDERTCPICLEFVGNIYEQDSLPAVPAHFRCRCNVSPA